MTRFFGERADIDIHPGSLLKMACKWPTKLANDTAGKAVRAIMALDSKSEIKARLITNNLSSLFKFTGVKPPQTINCRIIIRWSPWHADHRYVERHIIKIQKILKPQKTQTPTNTETNSIEQLHTITPLALSQSSQSHTSLSSHSVLSLRSISSDIHPHSSSAQSISDSSSVFQTLT